MFNNTSFYLFMIINFTIIVLLIYKILYYRKLLDKKNVQLIQFYLDTKFLCQNMAESLTIPNPAFFCSKLLQKIKEYYNLEDIIIIDSIKMITGENNTRLRSDVIKYIQKNADNILKNLDEYELIKYNFSTINKNYEIYISRIVSKEEGDGLIVCVENAPTLLTKQEKTSLENCLNLLKNRLLYG